MPATPSATSVVPRRQARPNESDTITPISTPVQSRIGVAQIRRGGVRIDRQQDERVRPLRVRRVDTGRGADEAVTRLGDDERRSGSHDLARLSEDHLEPPRIGVARRARVRGRTARSHRDGRLDLRPSRRPSARRRARRRPRGPPRRPPPRTRSAARSSPSSSSGIPRSGMTRSSRLNRGP